MKKYTFVLIALMYLSAINNVIGQTTFTSSKYPYSFTIPDGWRSKDQIYFPETDAKIVDDRGNSFIVSVKLLPNEFRRKKVEDIFNTLSDEEIKISQSPSDFENVRITKRGVTYIGGRAFYYVFCNVPFPDNLRLNHKMFYYIHQSRIYTIDCSSISSMSLDVAPFLDVMLETLKFK
jgi:hypothetical protein